MKKDVHPKYNKKTKVTCACGNSFEVGSTQDEIKTEICSACHPFYTGKQKFIDTARRVEKFEEKQAKVAAIKKTRGSTAGKKKRRAIRAKKKVTPVKKPATKRPGLKKK